VSFRLKVLLTIALAVALPVWLVAWLATSSITKTFEQRDQRRAQALVAQVRRELAQRGQDLNQRLDNLARSAEIQAMLNQPDPAAFVNEAAALAREQRLDFFEIIGADAAIISSAHWPARFGYKKDWILMSDWKRQEPFLQAEELADGPALGLFQVRAVAPLYLFAGLRLDESVVQDIPVVEGMKLGLRREEIPAGYNVTELPLRGRHQQRLATLFIGQSRQELEEVRRFIVRTAWLVGGAGLLLGILLSFWASYRVTRPLEHLAASVRQVAGGEWQARAEVRSRDEIGQLARDFNSMTEQLVATKQRMLQAERVAAWRELARRLAHELKNPLFPLQITIENLRRVRETKPEQFEEVFAESTSTLLAELDQLKTIVSRFSDFAKMPAPRFEPVDLSRLVRDTLRLVEAQLAERKVTANFELAGNLPAMEADPDLLRRALLNLVLNALDAMPEGGGLTVRTSTTGGRVRLEVTDTGEGLPEEERARLFTPYYTTKQHGTGLGLAIVQSVVADHGASIRVESAPGAGTTFQIDFQTSLNGNPR
jgi:signal transduction histidine kinase